MTGLRVSRPKIDGMSRFDFLVIVGLLLWIAFRVEEIRRDIGKLKDRTK